MDHIIWSFKRSLLNTYPKEVSDTHILQAVFALISAQGLDDGESVQLQSCSGRGNLLIYKL